MCHHHHHHHHHRHEQMGQGSVFVAGLSEYRVSCLADVMRLLHIGAQNRIVRATEYNEASSRSHAILQITASLVFRRVGQSDDDEGGGGAVMRRSKLTMVDLAGSEKWKTTTEVVIAGERQTELMAINLSLSALGNCIAALTRKHRQHVPFRDSSLTRLLQVRI